MTIPANEPQKITALGNGVATVFSFSPMIIFANADLFVTHVNAAGVETLLSEGTGSTKYSVTAPTLPGTGSITYPADQVTPIPTGEKLVIKPVLLLEQKTDLQNQGGYFPDTQEIQFDKIVKQNIQQQEEIDRSMQLPISVTGVSVDLPIPVADQVIGWNATATALINKASPGALSVSAFVQTLLDDLTAEAFRDTLFGDATKGALVVGQAGGGSELLPAGTTGQIAEVDATPTAGLAYKSTPTRLQDWLKTILTTAGDFFVRGATNVERFAVGTTGQLLSVDTQLANKVRWVPALTGYIDQKSLVITQDTDTDHDINVAAGLVCEVGGVIVKTPAEMTKQIDVPWAAGDDQGGMFSGTVTNNTTYHYFILRQQSTGNIDYGFDTSATGANAPTGWDARRIGAVVTDGTANIIAFVQHYNKFLWKVPVSDYAVSNPGATAILRTLSVPTGIKVEPIHSVYLKENVSSAEVQALVTSPDQADTAPSTTVFTVALQCPAATAHNGSGTASLVGIWTNTSAEIRTRVSTGGFSLQLRGTTHGWIDPLQ